MVTGREANLSVLINLFDGDVFKLLAKSREYNRIMVSLSTKSLERLLIELLINQEWEDRVIAATLSDDGHVMSVKRVCRVRKELKGESIG